MDPLSIASAATALAAFAYKLSKSLYEFVDDVGSGESRLQAMGSEVERLSQILTSLSEVLEDPRFEKAYVSVGTDDKRESHLRGLAQIITDCDETLKKLETILNKLTGGKGKVKAAVAGMKLKFKSSGIELLRRQIQDSLRALQLSLHTATLLLAADSKLSLGQLDHTIGEGFSSLRDQFTILHLRMSRGTAVDVEEIDPNEVSIHEAKVEHLKTYISATESIVVSASVYVGSMTGTSRNDGSVAGFDPEKRRTVRQSVYRQRIEDDSSSEKDDFQISRTSRLRSLGEKRLLEKNYPKAQAFFTKFLEKAEASGSWAPKEITEARMGLAAAYRAQGKFEDAKKALETSCQNENLPRDLKMQITHDLAEVCYLNKDYTNAKFHAEKVTQHRLDHFGDKNEQFFVSIGLLATILHALDETEEAEVCEEYLPEDWTPPQRFASEIQEQNLGGLSGVYPDAGRTKRDTTGSTRPHEIAAKVKAVIRNAILRDAIVEGEAAVCGFLLSDGADPNTRYENGKSALEQAISRDQTEIAKLLIQCGADMNTEKPSFTDLANFAIQKKNEQLVAALLEAGSAAPPNSVDLQLLLREAISAQNLPITKSLLAVDFVPDSKEKIDYHDLLKLAISVCEDPKEVVKCLLRAGGDANVNILEGKLILHEAVKHYKSDDGVIRLLLRARADPNLKDEGSSVLHRVVELGAHGIPLISLFLEAGCDVNAKSSSQRPKNRRYSFLTSNEVTEGSLLHIAVRAKEPSLRIVEVLLSKGADPNVKDSVGRSVLHAACTSEASDPEIIQRLINANADLHATDDKEVTVLNAAATSGNTRVFEMIFSRANPSSKLLNETFVLYSAIASKNSEIVRKVLEKGANPKLYPANKPSTIRAAVKTDNVDIVKMLIDRRVEISEVSRSDQVLRCLALGEAIQGRYHNIMKLLLDAGASAADYCDGYNTPPLSIAVEKEDPQAVELLLKAGAKIHWRDYDANDNALASTLNNTYFYNAKEANTSIVEQLLRAGAKVQTIVAQPHMLLLSKLARENASIGSLISEKEKQRLAKASSG